MPFLLDTNAAIAVLKGNPTVLGHVRAVGRRELHICATVESELWYGVEKSQRRAENAARLVELLGWLPSLPFASDATRRFAQIRVQLARAGTPIGPYDLQIAATALAHQMTLVTNNTDEFQRVDGLRIEDWSC
ncbi:type II toxin-antitoxin system VapC family toxin [Thiohalocapsa sp. ML1]|jgi:tRNA(fMet)-specific endonuclease VapC|uniref:type II toxin-antitoxin system VapC family toxin n=1 Tax=Thiohalocapsa sp. ML1 TaxID=1431688 RepID=UPI000731EEF4|nr:type II toxin-antitoxin system VapC family toxin [Thiohalocapsa sp. ML1]